MCGIAGIMNVNGKPVSTKVLQRMTRTLGHRGPDGEGVWVEGLVGLGHRRLAILDLSPAGRQPMQSDDGRFVIVYNGEVYNFQNLRVELEARGHPFRTRTDTEVVLRAFQEWGRACIHRFNGMFAFAVWDRNEKELFLARDRYGIKPLYYTVRNGVLLFGSEIKALLTHPDVSVRVSIPALNEYFSFQNIFSDLTLFEGIHLLPPAYTLRVCEGGEPVRERYWDYDFKDRLTLTEEECVEEFARLFEQAV
ncbi:MAG: asparagine synthase (glutamine-hydrolyzing), partial [Rhodothermales bacterium]